MSEKPRSEDPVFTALNLERDISEKLKEHSDRARKEVRNDMEKWLELMESPKVRNSYTEELGELDPERTKAELLTAIKETYPKIASQLGWTPDIGARFEQAA